MSSSIIIDANMLLLLVVGSTHASYIGKHKRLKDVFTEDEFNMLIDLIKEYENLVVTPNILTETSNLIGHISEPALSAIRLQLARFIQLSHEEYVESRKACRELSFIKLGLTDASLLDYLKNNKTSTLLTVDLDLAIQAEINELNVINFNHLR